MAVTDVIDLCAEAAKAEGITLDVYLAKKAASIEWGVHKHTDRVAKAYLNLTNCMILNLTYEETKTLLTEIKLASRDLAKYLSDTLNDKFHVRPVDIVDLRARHPKSVDQLYLNLTQWAWRFSTMPPQPVNATRNYYVSELTELHYLADDLAKIMENTSVDKYYRENGGEVNL